MAKTAKGKSIMGEVRQQIQQVDDDYLAGLSNKGIVKRAYKDLNQEQPTAVWQEDENRCQNKRARNYR